MPRARPGLAPPGRGPEMASAAAGGQEVTLARSPAPSTSTTPSTGGRCSAICMSGRTARQRPHRAPPTGTAGAYLGNPADPPTATHNQGTTARKWAANHGRTGCRLYNDCEHWLRENYIYEGLIMRMNISVPDDLGAAVRELKLPYLGDLPERPARRGRQTRRSRPGHEHAADHHRDREPSVTQGFIGRWLVEPDRDGTRSGTARDKDSYWGIALTRRGRFAVYVAHRYGRWPARLDDYETIDQALEHAPRHIIMRAVAELGETGSSGATSEWPA